MQRVLITGGAGFLGRALIARAPAGWDLHATQRRAAAPTANGHALDLADRAQVDRLWRQVAPAVVIHTAYSAESPEADIWQATRNVVDATREIGAELLYLSTDMVLDGESAPFAEDALPAPVLEYGRWKARAEDYVRDSMLGAAVVRSSLLTSFAPLDPRSEWIASALRGEVDIVLFADEIRSPILVEDLADQLWEICELGEQARAGVWHLAGPEALSRYAIGLLVAAALEMPANRLRAGSIRDSATPRPRDLRLLTGRADRTLRTRARPLSAVVGHRARGSQ